MQSYEATTWLFFQVQAIVDHHHPLQVDKTSKVRFQDSEDDANAAKEQELVELAAHDARPSSPPPTSTNQANDIKISSPQSPPNEAAVSEDDIAQESPPPYTPLIAQSNSFDTLLAIKP